MDCKLVLLKQSIEQTRIDKMGKYPWKKQRLHYKFWYSPEDHLTKKFILNPVEANRSAPTRIPNQHQSVMGWQWGQGLWKCSYISK